MQIKEERDFKGVWIPKEIWLNEDLGWSEKLLLVEINSLDNEDGCYATNAYIAKFFGLSKDRISKMISSLKKKGYLDYKFIYKEGSKEVDKRVIKINKLKYHGIENDTCMNKQLEGIVENNYRGIGENNEDNNTLINNTINNNKTSSPKFSTFDMEASEYLLKRIRDNNPEHKQPNLENWAKTFRLIREKDNRTEQQIMFLIDWVQNDEFWKTNVLSASKLREKWDQLVMKMRSQSNKASNKPKNNFMEALNEQTGSSNFINNDSKLLSF